MGLFDGYFDPRQFGEGGGLLGRLIALQQQQGPDQPGTDVDPASAVSQTPVLAPLPSLAPLPWPSLPDNGQASSVAQPPSPDLHSQYQALRPILGDRNAMLATVHPDIGKTLIAQALANQDGLVRRSHQD